jgi:hypothetical protein
MLSEQLHNCSSTQDHRAERENKRVGGSSTCTSVGDRLQHFTEYSSLLHIISNELHIILNFSFVTPAFHTDTPRAQLTASSSLGCNNEIPKNCDFLKTGVPRDGLVD